MNAKTYAIASIMEAAVGWQKLHTFIVESNNDEKVLKDVFKNLGIHIDTAIISHRDQHVGHFRPEIVSRARAFGVQV